jgi:hypothetical protein
VLGSIAANAKLVGADAAVPANMLTPPMSASRRDIVSVWTGPSSCLSITSPDLRTARQHYIKSPSDKEMTESKLSSKLIRKWQKAYQFSNGRCWRKAVILIMSG